MMGAAPGSAAADVHVIGGGMAGLAAAIAAAEAGARVALFEAAPAVFRGGNTRHSRNLRIAHPAPTAFQPGSYPPAAFADDLTRAAGGAGDPALIRALAEGSVGLAERLAAAGVVFQTADIPFSRKTAFFLGGGRTAVNALHTRAERLGVAICYQHRIAALDPERPGAPAVVVACGGSQSDLSHGHVDRGAPYMTGDILRALLAAGVRPTGRVEDHHLVAVDARSPDHDGGIVTRMDRFDLGMVVDARGLRLADETADRGPTRYGIWGRRIAGLPERFAVLVLDATGRARMPPTLYPPIEAGNLADLAARLALDADALATSAAACGRIAQAPFCAWPLRAGTSFGGLGVAVDPEARVVMADGSTRPGLFAAGMITAPAVFGPGYVAGAAVTLAAVSGFLAGAGAARHALSR